MSTPQQQAEELSFQDELQYLIWFRPGMREEYFSFFDRAKPFLGKVAAALAAKDVEINELSGRKLHQSELIECYQKEGKNQRDEIAQLRSQLGKATDIMKMSKLSLEIFLTRGDFADDDRPKIKRWLASIDSWIAQAERKG